MLEPHSEPVSQKAPMTFLPQELPLQTFPGTQLSSTVHAVKQRSPLHLNGAHATLFGGTQAPVALQVAAGVYTPLPQRSAAHIVPGAYLRQARAPSHLPSVPHEAAPWSVQMFRGSS
jgi:hypothetical protein